LLKSLNTNNYKSLKLEKKMNKDIKNKIQKYLVVRIYLTTTIIMSILFLSTGRLISGLILGLIAVSGLFLHEKVKRDLKL